jgi:hypothetical protein
VRRAPDASARQQRHDARILTDAAAALKQRIPHRDVAG